MKNADMPIKLFIRSVLREGASLIAMYLLGTVISALLWWPLAVIYPAYCLLSNWLYMAWVCPYCGHYGAGTCRAGYDRLSGRRFKPQPGKNSAQQFRRYVVVLFPGWFLPPAIGLYLLFKNFSWPLLGIVAVFCLVGFVILPIDSQRHCRECKNKRCPRRRKSLPPQASSDSSS